MSYHAISLHRSMALDAVRNAAYDAALRAAIEPGSVVLDVGAGTGLHGVMAARAGAGRVYLVEPEDVIAVADEIVRANGLEDTVRCIQGRIEDVDLPEPVDVIVSVLTGNFLLTEDLLDSLFYARDRWLKPGGTLLPGAARMCAVPVSAPDLHAKEVAAWSTRPGGIDLAPARPYAANTIFYRTELRRARWLAEPATLHTIDFASARYEPIQAAVSCEVNADGLCHGWAGWFDMRLGDAWLSTSPRAAAMHWTPAFLPADPPVPMTRGEQASLSLARTPFGDWTWTLGSAAGAQRHSTLLAEPLTTRTLERASLSHCPALNPEGQVLLELLSRFNGSTSVDDLADSLLASHPARFRTRDDAARFVRRFLKPFA